MDSAWDTMRDAMAEARAIFNSANQYAAQMAMMIRGRLRECSADDLRAIKRELRDFNIHTGEWKQ